MSPPNSEEAKSPASPATITAQQETTSTVGEETISCASPKFLVDQQQTLKSCSAIKESSASLSPEASIHQPQNSLPSSAEDQLRRQITGLEDEIRRFKLNEKPGRELVKHTLLQEELAQLREKNLNLRVDLQVAQEKYQTLESQHHKYKKHMKKILGKAMKNLSTGLDLSEEGSAEPGRTAEGVVPGASLVPQQSASNTIAEKFTGTRSGFQVGVTSSTGASLAVQPNIFGQPSATGNPASFLGPIEGKKPFSSMFGDPQETIQLEADTKTVLISTPGFCNNQEQSFEEARLRRYELHHDNTAPSWIPDWSGVFGSFKAPGPQKPFGGTSSSSKGFFENGKKGKNRTEGGRRVRQTPGTIGTAGAINWDFLKPAKPEGDGMASMTAANTNTGKD